MKKLLVASIVATTAWAGLAGISDATPGGKVEICHFPGHQDPTNPDQPDFILDLALPRAERVAECTNLDGKVLRVGANSVSYIDDDIRRGHEVDVPDDV